ncbi:transposase [Nitrosomonas ureae]|uniref:transposase n=1 Tax=Nitrosomonas ureae TaxID=44577 RepID=UPI002156222F|nr:transposase [Nitrosomonas ureae]
MSKRTVSRLVEYYSRHDRSTLRNGEFWTDDYYAATVGEKADWGVIERYAKNQDRPKEKLYQFERF